MTENVTQSASVPNVIVTEKKFDRKFFVSASLIGIVYVVIITLIANLIGKEVAGVAGVALTALSTQIFKTFERLEFQQLPQDQIEIISFPKFKKWSFVNYTLMFLGIQVFIGFIAGGVALIFLYKELEENPLYLLSLILGSDESKGFIQDNLILIISIFLTAMCHFLGGLLIGKLVKNTKYYYAIFSSFLTTLLPFALLLPVVIYDLTKDKSPISVVGFLSPLGIYSILYIAFALLGAKIAKSHYQEV